MTLQDMINIITAYRNHQVVGVRFKGATEWSVLKVPEFDFVSCEFRIDGLQHGTYSGPTPTQQVSSAPLSDTERYKAGQKFMLNGAGPYLLAATGTQKACFVSLMGDGNRWSEAAEVRSSRDMTRAEIEELAGTGSVKLYIDPPAPSHITSSTLLPPMTPEEQRRLRVCYGELRNTIGHDVTVSTGFGEMDVSPRNNIKLTFLDGRLIDAVMKVPRSDEDATPPEDNTIETNPPQHPPPVRPVLLRIDLPHHPA